MLYESLINKSESIDNLPTAKMNFSIASDPIEVSEIPEVINFSEDPVGAVNNYINQCFSLIERIKMSKKSPKQVLRSRLNEVIRYCKANDAATIKSNRKIIVRYLSEYVYHIIMDCISNPSITKVNLTLILGLSQLMEKIDSATQLQDILRMAKMQLEKTGATSKNIQTKLSKAYAKFWTEFLFSIEETYLPEEKKGTLVHREKGMILNG